MDRHRGTSNDKMGIALPGGAEVCIDVHFAPLEVGLRLKLRERVLDHIAEVASFVRIDDIVHRRF